MSINECTQGNVCMTHRTDDPRNPHWFCNVCGARTRALTIPRCEDCEADRGWQENAEDQRERYHEARGGAAR